MHESPQPEPVVSDIFDNYHETQKEILDIETGKTRVKLFSIALVIFIFDFIAIAMVNLITPKSLLLILVVPVSMALLALLARKEPLLSMILATLILLGVWIYSVTLLGAKALMMGWLSKAILIYLFIAGFQNASTAQRIKKELSTL